MEKSYKIENQKKSSNPHLAALAVVTSAGIDSSEVLLSILLLRPEQIYITPTVVIMYQYHQHDYNWTKVWWNKILIRFNLV